MTDNRFAKSFCFVREHGERWYPVRRRSGEFRVYARGSNNKADAPIQPRDERSLQRLVFEKGLRAFCTPQVRQVKAVALSINGNSDVDLRDDLIDGRAKTALKQCTA